MLSAFLIRKPVGEQGTLFMGCGLFLVPWDRALETEPQLSSSSALQPLKKGFFSICSVARLANTLEPASG